MPKQRESGGDIGESVPTNDSGAPLGSHAHDDELKRAGGRTIAHWKQQIFAELTDGDDQTIASRLNQIAHEEGYDYHCTPAAVARWRQAETSVRTNGVPAGGEQADVYANVVFRQFVHLLGKDAV